MALAIFSGFLIGYYLSHRQTQYLLIIALLYKFRTKEKYEDLYELCDTEFIYEITKGVNNTYKSYSEFLLSHQLARPFAGDICIKYWNDISRMIKRNYLTVLVLSLVLFQKNVIYFVLPFIGVHLGYLAYHYYYRDNKIDFYAIFMHNLVINDTSVKARLE